jgi:hypothetical protein
VLESSDGALTNDNLAFSLTVLKVAFLEQGATLEWKLPASYYESGLKGGGEGQRTGKIGSTVSCNKLASVTD